MAEPPPSIDALRPETAAQADAREADSEPPESDADAKPIRWHTNAVLFALTLVSVFFTGAGYTGALHDADGIWDWIVALPQGWTFAVPLMGILLTHEFGHYFAARYHRVDASLPYFLPMPLSPFGTMGAVISMRGRIKSRNALLDIGASGPLAGLVVALPVLVLGLAGSPVQEVAAIEGTTFQEGQSLLYLAMKRLIVGPIPEGHDVFLNPIAFAGWAGLFVTALNLLPVGQLDGGHIAYALFGSKQNRYSGLIHWSLLGMFALNLYMFVWPVIQSQGSGGDGMSQAVSNSMFWLFWFGLLFLVRRMGGGDHPPTEPGELSPRRRWIAILSLVIFVLLFMPTPWSANG